MIPSPAERLTYLELSEKHHLAVIAMLRKEIRWWQGANLVTMLIAMVALMQTRGIL